MKSALALVLLCAVLLLASCSGEQDQKPETVPYSAGQMILVSASARQKVEEIYTDQVWSVPTGDNQTFEEAFTERLKNFFPEMAAMDQLAEERGIKLDSDERSSLEQAASSFYDSSVSGNSMFQGLGEKETRDLFLSYALAVKLRDSMVSDRNAEVSESEARVIRVQKLVFSSREDAENVAEKIASGTDFDTAGRESGAAENLSLMVKRGDLPQEIEKTLYALETDEISGVLKEDESYCIYRCVSSYDEEETAVHRQAMERERAREVLREACGSYLSEHEIVMDSGVWEQVVAAMDAPYAGENFFDAVKEAAALGREQ